MRIALLAGTAIFALTGASQASAQTAAPDSASAISEVVVTAQKRSENVQQVPIAVTVVSADQLSRRGTQTIQDLGQASASLEFGGGPGGGAFVRGIGTQSLSAATAQSSVSVVLDGVVLGNANVTDIFDMDHVEILKGPQGTLFGSSVSAGVISLTTKAPKIGVYSAYISAEYADKSVGSGYDRASLRAAVNLPINDTSALRVSAYGYDNYGLEHNTYTGANSNVGNYGVRARYLNQITDKLTLNLIADYGKSHATNNPGFIYFVAPAGSPLQHALTACGITASARNTSNCDGLLSQSDRTVGGLSAQLDYDFGNVMATSITSYRQANADSIADIIDIPPDITRRIFGAECHFTNCNPIVSLTSGGPSPQTDDSNLVTQEVRLASKANHQFEWVVGAYYQQYNFRRFQPSTLTVNIAGGSLTGDAVLSSTNTILSSTARDYAAFGNATYYFGPDTRLIVGARYTYSQVGEDAAVQTLKSLNPFAIGTVNGAASTTDKAFTWRAGLQHDFSPDTMGYVIASTGYKAPQINDNITTAPLSPIKSERPTSFELGLKQSLLNRRFYVDADVFYTQVSDFQTQSCVPSATLGIACSNINVPRVTTKGVEFEVFGQPFRGNTSSLSAAYVDAAYPANFYGADGTLLTGHQLNSSPKFKAAFSTEQVFPLGEQYSFVVGGDFTYRSEQSLYLSALPQYVTPAEVVGNVRVGIRSSNHWSAFLFVRNVGDTVYPTQLYPTQAFAPGGLWHFLDANSRRVTGIQLEANF
jgi:iron complex outermembrane receptor protein